MERPDGRRFEIRWIQGAPAGANFEILREVHAGVLAMREEYDFSWSRQNPYTRQLKSDHDPQRYKRASAGPRAPLQ